jgi:DNA-binding response OmpR family regulator
MIVLLVEDDDDLRALLEAALPPEFQVRSCGSGPEGLKRLESERFDVLLTDLDLPVVRGEDLVERARAMSPMGVVVMSGDPDRLESCRGLADAVVTKPFPLRAVRAALRRAVGCATLRWLAMRPGPIGHH